MPCNANSRALSNEMLSELACLWCLYTELAAVGVEIKAQRCDAASLPPQSVVKALPFYFYPDSRGYVMLDQFTSADIDVFYGNWKPRARRASASER